MNDRFFRNYVHKIIDNVEEAIEKIVETALTWQLEQWEYEKLSQQRKIRKDKEYMYIYKGEKEEKSEKTGGEEKEEESRFELKDMLPRFSSYTIQRLAEQLYLPASDLSAK